MNQEYDKWDHYIIFRGDPLAVCGTNRLPVTLNRKEVSCPACLMKMKVQPGSLVKMTVEQMEKSARPDQYVEYYCLGCSKPLGTKYGQFIHDDETAACVNPVWKKDASYLFHFIDVPELVPFVK